MQIPRNSSRISRTLLDEALPYGKHKSDQQNKLRSISYQSRADTAELVEIRGRKDIQTKEYRIIFCCGTFFPLQIKVPQKKTTDLEKKICG